jgi:hypothetical protein
MTPTDPKRTVPGPDVHAYDRFHAEHGHAEHDGLYNEDVAHEYSDVNVRALLLSAAGLVAVVLVCAAAMYVLFGVFERMAAASDRAVTPLAGPAVTYPRGAAPTLLPPEPRLLTNEPQNLARVRAGEAANLQGIDEAKKQLLQQGLPVRADASTDPWLGTHAPARGESSGGRGILTKPAAAGQEEPQPAASQPAAQGTTPPKSGGH